MQATLYCRYLLYIRPINLVHDMNGANQNTATPLQCAAPPCMHAPKLRYGAVRYGAMGARWDAQMQPGVAV